MGRWTVEEWQTQTQEYGSFPGEAADWHDEDDDPIDSVWDEGDEHKFTKTLPGKALPPIPIKRSWPPDERDLPPQTHPALPHANAPAASPLAEGYVHRLFDAIRNKSGGNRRGTQVSVEVSGPASRPRITTTTTDKSAIGRIRSPAGYSHGHNYKLLASPVRSSPRSPTSSIRREFPARAGLKRTKSKSKLSKLASAAAGRAAPIPTSSKLKAKSKQPSDAYTYNAPGGTLQVFVSTQKTEVQSAHDVGRPRVFYPRSSSLPTARNAALAKPPPTANSMPRHMIAPVRESIPTPPVRESSRALPALPQLYHATIITREPSAPTGSISSEERYSRHSSTPARRVVRPLPVPVMPPPP